MIWLKKGDQRRVWLVPKAVDFGYNAWDHFSRNVPSRHEVAGMRSWRNTRVNLLAIAAVIGASACANGAWAVTAAPTIDFTRDVRPILADNCFACHGPDGEHREADLRLDLWNDEGDIRGAAAMIVAEKPGESELVARITSEDPDLRMPPADSGKSLKPEQIEMLQNWIAQGASHQQHWAFVPPVRPAVPKVIEAARIRNPIDAFVLARLEREKLSPAEPATRARAPSPPLARPRRLAANARRGCGIRGELRKG